MLADHFAAAIDHNARFVHVGVLFKHIDVVGLHEADLAALFLLCDGFEERDFERLFFDLLLEPRPQWENDARQEFGLEIE